MFIELKSNTGRYAIKLVRKLHSGLPALYDHKMEKIEKLKTEDRQRCQDLLMIVLLAKKLPLPLSNLRGLVPWTDDVDPHTIATKCGSFLITKDECVDVQHKSVQDYLKANEEKLRAGSIKSEADIARNSITAMSLILKRNIYDNKSWGVRIEDIIAPKDDPLTSIGYSSLFWLDHVYEAIGSSEDATELCSLALGFLEKHFLHWLESLSVLHGLLDGLRSIRKFLTAGNVG